MSAIRRRLAGLSILVTLGVMAVLAMPVSAAQAGVINLSACNIASLSQPFSPWLDPSWYELAPGGDFESDGWTLSGGAARVPGSEPFAATGTLGSWSLSLPAGASAESPPTCVDAAYPTIRFFTEGTGLLEVNVVYGNVTLPAGVDVVAGGWAPSLPMLTDSALVAATSDGSAQVSIQLNALAGDVRVDDVFVDPWNRG
ncbi:MAG TPA: hypothetical protein VME22_00615 [Solirubrobacteraceae bacterium]|nr:hypothetical protein [Solirubrobacteraceae bacterium]